MNQTMRDYIKRRVWWCLGIGFSGWLFTPLAGVIERSFPSVISAAVVPFAGIAGALVFAAAMLVMHRIVKCPKCKAKLARTIAMPLAFSRGSGPRINFCPYCGVNVDEPVPHAASQAQTQNPLNPIK